MDPSCSGLAVSPYGPTKKRCRTSAGPPALREGSASHSWSSVLAALDESQTRILEKLATISDEQLAAEPPAGINAFKAKSLDELLTIAHFHESYHSGQTGILRRLLGRDGAIR